MKKKTDKRPVAVKRVPVEDLINTILGDLSSLALGGKVSSVKAGLDNLLQEPETREASIPSVADILDSGNEKAKAYATGLRAHVPAPMKVVMPDPDEGEAGRDSSYGPIPLRVLRISKFNRSYKIPFRPEAVEKLRASIEEHGLLSSIVLVRSDSSAERPEVVLAGAHRVEALKLLRGTDGAVQPEEYRVLRLMADDRACLDVAISENRERSNMSVHDQALYMARLVEEEKFTQEELADKVGIPRPTANALLQLPKYWDVLPEKWTSDLSSCAEQMLGDSALVITSTHWREIVPVLNKAKGVDKKLSRIMNNAAENHWSVRQLHEKLGLHSGEGAAGEAGAGDAAPVSDKPKLRGRPTNAAAAAKAAKAAVKAVEAPKADTGPVEPVAGVAYGPVRELLVSAYKLAESDVDLAKTIQFAIDATDRRVPTVEKAA